MRKGNIGKDQGRESLNSVELIKIN